MKQLISTLFIATLTFGALSALAEDKSNTKDSMEGLTQKNSVEHNVDKTMTEPATGSIKKMDHSGMSPKNRMSSKMMDTNGDGMISKEEFMSHQEEMYSNMKQTNGGVSIKDMDAEMHIGTTKGNKLQPNDTKNKPPAAKY